MGRKKRFQIKHKQIMWVKYFIPSYIYAALIFTISSIPFAIAPVAGRFTDKYVHLMEYLIFGLLLARSFKNAKAVFFQSRFLILAIVIGGLYGLSDECHQIFVPRRYFELFDITIDVAGVGLGAFIYSMVCRKRM